MSVFKAGTTVPGVQKAEVTCQEYSPVPGVPKAETVGTPGYWYSADLSHPTYGRLADETLAPTS